MFSHEVNSPSIVHPIEISNKLAICVSIPSSPILLLSTIEISYSKTASAMPPRRYSSPEADSKLADERKQKRKESNRNSAKKSRERKERYLVQLMKEKEEFERVNSQIEMRIQMIHSNYLYVDQENGKLKRGVGKYAEQLRQLRDLLQLIEMTTGVKLDISELPDPDSILKPWKLPFLALPGVNAVKTSQLV